MHVVDEARLGIIAGPIMRDARPLAVGKDEAGDVDRVGARVLAELGRGAGADIGRQAKLPR